MTPASATVRESPLVVQWCLNLTLLLVWPARRPQQQQLMVLMSLSLLAVR